MFSKPTAMQVLAEHDTASTSALAFGLDAVLATLEPFHITAMGKPSEPTAMQNVGAEQETAVRLLKLGKVSTPGAIVHWVPSHLSTRAD